MNKVRELAKIFRELADLYEEIADTEENEELDAQEKEELLEQLTGKIIVKTLKVEKLK